MVHQNSANVYPCSKRVVQSLKIRERGKFLRIFNVNQNCAEHLFIIILLCYLYTFHTVFTKLCKFVAETYKTHSFKMLVLRKLKVTVFFLLIRISDISSENVSIQK